MQSALQTWVLNWVLSKELGGLASESEVHWSAYQNLLILFFLNLKQWYILKQMMKPKIIFCWILTTTCINCLSIGP